MTCQPTKTQPPEAIDFAALREKYRIEKEKRLRKEGQAQYQRPSGDFVPDYAVDPYKAVAPRDPVDEEIDVLVLGAGWGGIKASYYLTKEGVTNFRNVDTAGDFGGVWYWNQYPGVQCDNDAYCYLPLLEEMGFMPSKKFADGAEIQAYAKSIAERFEFADKALFHTQVTSVKWDETIKRWRIGTNRGDNIKARFVIVASGVLNMPKLPAVKGIETFRGKSFHTSRWHYGYTGGAYGNPVLGKLAALVPRQFRPYLNSANMHVISMSSSAHLRQWMSVLIHRRILNGQNHFSLDGRRNAWPISIVARRKSSSPVSKT